MMMRIDDRHCRIDRLLAPQSEPILVDGEEDPFFGLGFTDLDVHALLPQRSLL